MIRNKISVLELQNRINKGEHVFKNMDFDFIALEGLKFEKLDYIFENITFTGDNFHINNIILERTTLEFRNINLKKTNLYLNNINSDRSTIIFDLINSTKSNLSLVNISGNCGYCNIVLNDIDVENLIINDIKLDSGGIWCRNIKISQGKFDLNNIIINDSEYLIDISSQNIDEFTSLFTHNLINHFISEEKSKIDESPFQYIGPHPLVLENIDTDNSYFILKNIKVKGNIKIDRIKATERKYELNNILLLSGNCEIQDINLINCNVIIDTIKAESGDITLDTFHLDKKRFKIININCKTLISNNFRIEGNIEFINIRSKECYLIDIKNGDDNVKYDNIKIDNILKFKKIKYGDGIIEYHKINIKKGMLLFEDITYKNNLVKYHIINIEKGKLTMRNIMYSSGNVIYKMVCIKNGNFILSNINFNSTNVEFIKIQLKNAKAYFKYITINNNKTLFENIEGDILFKSVYFGKNTYIIKNDISNWIFIDSDINNNKFLMNKYNIKKSRIILRNETIGENYIQMENIYMQLKSSFENIKSYNLSYKAYYSEMEMKRKILLKNIKENGENIPKYIIHIIYKIFGGYTINYTIPLYWLLLNTFIIYPIINVIIRYKYNPFKVETFSYSDFITIIQRELYVLIEYTIPFIPINKNRTNLIPEYILYPEILINIILITFFIIGLKKAFK